MCNLVDAFMEEQYQDPEFLSWLEQKNQEQTQRMQDEIMSLEYAYDVMCQKRYEEEFEMMKESAETDYEYCM
jgi:hypothetical protein